jgi:hypothetical protein
MSKPVFLSVCAVALLISSVAFFKASHKVTVRGNIIDSQEQSPSKQETIPPPPSRPAPPPATENAKIESSPIEPARTLIGVTNEEIARVESFLPKREKVATYPVGNSSRKAALAYTDLDGDGTPETIFVHIGEETATANNIPLLQLDVINGKNPTKRVSIQLAGLYIYSDINNQAAVPFAVRDMNGDGRPEIIVTSAIGASVGATLQVFSLDGGSFSEIARVEGHHFEITSRDAGKAAVIRSRWKNEQAVISFVWDGHKFQETK